MLAKPKDGVRQSDQGSLPIMTNSSSFPETPQQRQTDSRSGTTNSVPFSQLEQKLGEGTYLLFKQQTRDGGDQETTSIIKLQALKHSQSKEFLCQTLQLFNSQFDCSLVLIPYVVRRSGWLSFSLITLAFSCLSYFSSTLVYESIRLIQGNFKLKQRNQDFESLLSAHMTSKSLAVVLSRHLYLIQLVCYATIGIIISTYTCDNLFQAIFGRTYALQILPDIEILSEINSGTQPFIHNFLCVSIGLGIIILTSAQTKNKLVQLIDSNIFSNLCQGLIRLMQLVSTSQSIHNPALCHSFNNLLLYKRPCFLKRLRLGPHLRFLIQLLLYDRHLCLQLQPAYTDTSANQEQRLKLQSFSLCGPFSWFHDQDSFRSNGCPSLYT